jgi:hypothetical protein
VITGELFRNREWGRRLREEGDDRWGPDVREREGERVGLGWFGLVLGPEHGPSWAAGSFLFIFFCSLFLLFLKSVLGF